MMKTEKGMFDGNNISVSIDKKNNDYKVYETDEKGKLLSYFFVHRAVNKDDNTNVYD